MEQKTYRTVLSYIKDMIRSGRLAVGDRLPTERCLSSQLSISRNTVRDAMRILESMGIVESRQGSGNYLAARMDQYLSESLQFLLLLSQLSYLEINQLRRAVELEACRLATERQTAGQLDEMAALLDIMENSPPADQPSADQQFHHTILQASGNADSDDGRSVRCMRKPDIRPCPRPVPGRNRGAHGDAPENPVRPETAKPGRLPGCSQPAL